MRPIKRVTHLEPDARQSREARLRALAHGIEPEIADDLEAAVREADIVSCATLSATPLIRGAWLKHGAHLDLVGAFTPKMREADDDAIRRSRVYVDTRVGAPKEAGDIVQPLKKGVLKKTDIRGDLLRSLPRQGEGPHQATEITLFKSVGAAMEDSGGGDAGVESNSAMIVFSISRAIQRGS